MENGNGKKTLGRRKIPMKKIEKKSSLQVTFTKRRGSLFRKATELSLLCGVEIAVLVQSPAGKLYASGDPSVAALINLIDPDGEYEEAMKLLEAEKRRATTENGGFCWEKPYRSLELELQELEELLTAVEHFRDKGKGSG